MEEVFGRGEFGGVGGLLLVLGRLGVGVAFEFRGRVGFVGMDFRFYVFFILLEILKCYILLVG